MSDGSETWEIEQILARVAAASMRQVSDGGSGDGGSEISSDKDNPKSNTTGNAPACIAVSTAQPSETCLPSVSSYFEGNGLCSEMYCCVPSPMSTADPNVLLLANEGINSSVAVAPITTTAAEGASICTYTPGEVHTTPECLLPTPSTSPFSAVNGLSPSTESVRTVRMQLRQSTETPTRTSGASGRGMDVASTPSGLPPTPFWLHSSGYCGITGSRSANNNNNNNNNDNSLTGKEALGSQGTLLNFPTLETTMNADLISPYSSSQSGGVLLRNGPYTLQGQQHHYTDGLSQVGTSRGTVLQQQQEEHLPCILLCKSFPEDLRNSYIVPTTSIDPRACQAIQAIPENRNTILTDMKSGFQGMLPTSTCFYPEERWTGLNGFSAALPLGRGMGSFPLSISETPSVTRHSSHTKQTNNCSQRQQSVALPLVSADAGNRCYPSMMLSASRCNLQSCTRTTKTIKTPILTTGQAPFDMIPSRKSSQIIPQSTSLPELDLSQHGCRFMQSVLETERYRSAPVQRIVKDLLADLPRVMMSQHGNFLAQKLLHVVPNKERMMILSEHLSEQLCTIAVSPHGNYAVQNLIDSLRSEGEIDLVCNALERDPIMLMTNPGGSHVVNKLLERVPEHAMFLYNAIVNHTVRICNDKQGCCVVQNCMKFAPSGQQARLQEAVLHHVVSLATSPFGNYVLTHLFEFCANSGKRTVVDEAAFLIKHVLKALCTDKFASNVVETILRYCSPRMSMEICRMLLDTSDDLIALTRSIPSNTPISRRSPNGGSTNGLSPSSSSALSTIACNQYGNYVVQTMLDVLPLGPELVQLVESLEELFPLMRGARFENRVILKVKLARERFGSYEKQRNDDSEDDIFFTGISSQDVELTHTSAIKPIRGPSTLHQPQPHQRQRNQLPTLSKSAFLPNTGRTAAYEPCVPSFCYSASDSHTPSLTLHGQQQQHAVMFPSQLLTQDEEERQASGECGNRRITRLW